MYIFRGLSAEVDELNARKESLLRRAFKSLTKVNITTFTFPSLALIW